MVDISMTDSMIYIKLTTFSDIRYSYLDEEYDRKMKELFNTHIMTM